MSMGFTLEHVLSRVDTLPALPEIVAKLLEALSDDDAHAEDLSNDIASDPAVVGRLLAAANAGAVGACGRVDSVRQAIMLLGVSRVKDITMATAIIDRFSVEPPFDMHRLWLHSLGVAICAREVARTTGLNLDVAYTAGLLHDVGQLLLFSVDPAAYAGVMTLRAGRDMDIVDAEREHLGIDHAHAGSELAKIWKLPQAVVDAIAGHHVSDEDSPASAIADVVHVAEVLSHALDLGGSADARVPNLSDLSCVRLDIDWRRFAASFPRIEAKFSSARLMLGL